MQALLSLSQMLWSLGLLGFLVASLWLSIIDIETRRLPNALLGWLSWLTLLSFAASSALLLPTPHAAEGVADLTQLVLGGAGLFAGFYLLWRLRPGGLGGGDVKLAPLVGGVAGMLGGMWAVLMCAALAFAIAAVWGKMRARKDSGARFVAFAPCLFASAWVLTILVSIRG